MRVIVYDLFSLGLLTLIGTLLTHDFYRMLAFSLAVAGISNTLIESITVGIENEIIDEQGMVTVKLRSPNHSISNIMFLSISPALLLLIFIYYASGSLDNELVILTLISPLNGLAHILLDVITEKGIFIKKNGKWTKFALSYFSYKDPKLSLVVSLLGVMLILITMKLFA